MANDVEITWVPKALNLVTNIVDIIVVKGASPGVNQCSHLENLAIAGTASSGGSDGIVYTDTTKAATSFTEVGVTAGTYYYGVFARNTAGVNTCLGGGSSFDSVTIP
jgi:hypothetical protein